MLNYMNKIFYFGKKEKWLLIVEFMILILAIFGSTYSILDKLGVCQHQTISSLGMPPDQLYTSMVSCSDLAISPFVELVQSVLGMPLLVLVIVSFLLGVIFIVEAIVLGVLKRTTNFPYLHWAVYIMIFPILIFTFLVVMMRGSNGILPF